MSVAILNRYFWPESLSTMPLIYGDIAQYHIDLGHKVIICTGCSQDYSKYYESRYQKNLTAYTFISPADRDGSLFRRILNMIKLIAKSSKIIFSRTEGELTYLETNPPFFAMLVMLFGRITMRDRKFIFYIQDNHIYRMPNNFFKWFYKTSLKISIMLSDKSIVISGSMQEELMSYFKDSSSRLDASKKLYILRNYSVDFEKEACQNSEKSIDIIYAGNHGEAQKLDLFLSALKIIDDPNLKIHFYGSGLEKKNLIAFADQSKLKICFEDTLPRHEVNNKIKNARFGLVGANHDLMKYAFPSKLANYNILGVPGIVMCDPESLEARFIEDNKLGIVVSATSPHEIAKKVAEYLKQDQLSYELVKRNAENIFSKEQYFKKFIAVLGD